MDEAHFEIDPQAGGGVILKWKGEKPLVLERIITAGGKELPVISGLNVLAPGAPLTLPFGAAGKIRAIGDVIRNGVVVRD